jgi:hypothetical protein
VLQFFFTAMLHAVALHYHANDSIQTSTRFAFFRSIYCWLLDMHAMAALVQLLRVGEYS